MTVEGFFVAWMERSAIREDCILDNDVPEIVPADYRSR
jgi:hypothetical protein